MCADGKPFGRTRRRDMYGWLRKLVNSRVSSPCRDSPQQATKLTTKSTVPPVTSVALSPLSPSSPSSSPSSSSSSSSSPSSSSSSSSHTSSAKPPRPSALSSRVRWSLEYDVFVCHSSLDSDMEEAARLVSFLEASPCGLRCFLWHRDSTPGAAIPTELCQAVQSSHCRALLITPSFLQDEWCKYMMHQAMADSPMSNRIIPLIQGLSHPKTQYPRELTFCHYFNLSKNPDQGYTVVHKVVLMYLEDMVKKDVTHSCDMDSSGSSFLGEDGSRQNKLVSNGATTEPSLSLTPPLH